MSLVLQWFVIRVWCLIMTFVLICPTCYDKAQLYSSKGLPLQPPGKQIISHSVDFWYSPVEKRWQQNFGHQSLSKITTCNCTSCRSFEPLPSTTTSYLWSCSSQPARLRIPATITSTNSHLPLILRSLLALLLPPLPLHIPTTHNVSLLLQKLPYFLPRNGGFSPGWVVWHVGAAVAGIGLQSAVRQDPPIEVAALCNRGRRWPSSFHGVLP